MSKKVDFKHDEVSNCKVTENVHLLYALSLDNALSLDKSMQCESSR